MCKGSCLSWKAQVPWQLRPDTRNGCIAWDKMLNNRVKLVYLG